ncbi:MAG: hypothetical protein R6U98_30305 [Pirellulaceae bacterium]
MESTQEGVKYPGGLGDSFLGAKIPVNNQSGGPGEFRLSCFGRDPAAVPAAASPITTMIEWKALKKA